MGRLSSRLKAPLRSPWSSSRTRQTQNLTAQQDEEIQNVERVDESQSRDIVDRKKWHFDVNNCQDIWEFLTTGYPPLESLRHELLVRATAGYLSRLDPRSDLRDRCLEELINDGGNESLPRDMAVLACVSSLSIPAARTHIISLMNFLPERYLRCVLLVGQLQPRITSNEELRIARFVHQLLLGDEEALLLLKGLCETITLGIRCYLLPISWIHDALSMSDTRSRLEGRLNSLLHQTKYMSAFSQITWLQRVPGIPNNGDVIKLLDDCFPSWSSVLSWKPKPDRIDQWENGSFTQAQKIKLSSLIQLDGPDTNNWRQSTQMMSEPECYQNVQVQPQNTETLERLLDALSKAEKIGPAALNLFIYHCIDKLADDVSLALVDDALNTGDESFCGKLLTFLRLQDPELSLWQKMSDISKVLPILDDQRLWRGSSFSTETFLILLAHTFESAQAAFITQLEKGTGERMGMRIKDLGDAVLNATWIHSKLPPEMLTQVAKFPEKDGLRAIFDQLQEKSAIHSAKISRFKSFLESSIGGKKVTCDDKSITLGAIQKEVRFWQLSPDTDRKDLARALGKIEKLDYSLYTACLVVIIQEEDFLVRKLNLWLQPGGEERCLNFAKNLAQRRELNQFQDECWLLLLIALINEQGPRFLQNLSRCRSPAEWLELVDVVTRLLGLVRSRLPRAGAGVTQERLQWWGQLSTKTLASIQSFLKRLNEERDFEWMYFPTDQEQANNLLDLTKQWPRMTLLHRHIVSLLSSNGSNIALVCECIRALGQSSPLGQSVCERILARTGGVIKWPPDQLAIVTEGWLRSRILDSPDKATIRLLQGLLRHPSRAEAWSLDLRFTTEQLESSVETLLKKASELEALRTGFRRQHPLEMTALLSRMGVDDTSSGRAGNEDIPEELSDAIEIVDGDTYEICFVLTELSVLQRLARGISEDSRLLLIRVRIRGSPRFCIHFFSNSEGEQEHDYWRPTRWSDPNNDICTTRSTIFTYYLARNLHRTLRKVNPTLREIHSMVRKLIHTPPATCLVCPSNTSASLWKASACSKDCTIQLRKSPLSVRLHNMLVDPSAMDLILTSIYAAAVEGRDLLPGCPIERATLCSVIDSFPSLETIQTSGNLQQAIRGTDTLGKDREKLLSWLCLTFRGFIVKAPGDFRIPSMPNTHQYLMLNSNHDQELNFKTHLMANEGATTGVVFHGTPTSHLFKILVEGLKVMYGADVLHGAALGSGVYCGDDQATSFPYAGATGSSWRHSKMGNMKIMLGCELAGYVAPAGYNAHVVDNGEKLLIRYIFLLPQNYQPPPRHHVEPAMKTAYAKIRSGMVI